MPNESTDALVKRLSARQREVLELLAKGLTNEDIAGVLGVAHGTVRTHVSAVLRILQVANRTEAASALQAREPSEDTAFDRPALAVLPLDTEHVYDPNARAFASGIPDDLIRLFSRWAAGISVIARSSSLDAVRVAGGAREVGRALGASYLVSGRAHEIGGCIVVQIHLEEAARETTVWAERYDIELCDLVEAHDELAETIVERVHARLIETPSIAMAPGVTLARLQ